MKIISRFRNRLVPVLAVLSLSLASLGLPALVLADNFSQGYAAQGNLQPGDIVAISDSSSATVTAVPSSNPDRIYGVVINQSQAPITLNRSGQQVIVATTGTYPVIVSNIYGSIAVGDYVSVSDQDGIGAKATANHDYILGQAIQAFDGTNNVVSHNGSSAIGRINVAIKPGKNPVLDNQLALPGPLRRAGTTIAGHPVSAARVWAALIIFLAAAAIAIILLIIGVRSAITAIGRNPLSRHTILQGLFQVVTTSIIIFIVGLFTVYLLLRL